MSTTRELALTMLKKIANCRGDETLPTEDVIDLAQAVLFLVEDERCPACGSTARSVALVYYPATNRGPHPFSCYDSWHLGQS